MRNVITAFKEHKIFKNNRPWDVNTMTFASDTITSPHYADTIEVLLCCDIKGEIYIGGHKYGLCGKQVFFIPPKTVHSVFYKKNDGYVKVLKINFEQLKPLIGIEEILKYENKSFLCLPTQLPCFEQTAKIADTFRNSDSIFEVCESILYFFGLLVRYSQTSDLNVLKNNSSNNNLRKIIVWTENNYLNKISLTDISNLVGYEKHYFCSKFKSLTGISYINYVNNLRIRHACSLLANGTSVATVSESCGFDNASYFIQLFKKTIGITPKAYAKKYSKFDGGKSI